MFLGSLFLNQLIDIGLQRASGLVYPAPRKQGVAWAYCARLQHNQAVLTFLLYLNNTKCTDYCGQEARKTTVTCILIFTSARKQSPYQF